MKESYGAEPNQASVTKGQGCHRQTRPMPFRFGCGLGYAISIKLNMLDCTKEQWINIVKKKIKEKNCSDLLAKMKVTVAGIARTFKVKPT